MKQLIIVFLFFLSFSYLYSQEDTLTRTIDYKEVVIQGTKKKDDGATAAQLQISTESLLNTLPEITMIKRGNYALEPTIRGLNAGQINMTIDGMQMFGACTDKMDVISSYIEPTNLEKIELSTSPDGNQTGSSIGGGINFSLMKAQLDAPRKFSGMAGVGYQTNANYMQTLGKFQYSTKRFAVLVNGIYRNADNYHASKRKEIQFSQFEKWNAGLSVVGKINDKNIIALDYIHDEGYNIGYPALTMDVGYAKAYISGLTHTYTNYEKVLRSVETKVFFNYIDHTMDDTKRPAEMVPMHMDMPGTSRTFGANSRAIFRLKGNHSLSVQLNAYQNDLHAEMTMYPDFGSDMFMLTIPDGRRRTVGVTVADKWIINSEWRLAYGGRIEYNGFDITTDVGRSTLTSFYTGDPQQTRMAGNIFAQGDFQLNKNTGLYAGVNYAHRPPSIQELYGFYLFNRVDNHDYIGNPDSKNESSVNANIGVKLNYKQVAFRVEGFVNSFSNYITGLIQDGYGNMAPGASGVKQFSNIPGAVLTGGELSVKYEPIKDLSLESINSYTYGVDDAGNYLPYIPPFKSVNAVTYNLKGFVFRVEHIGAMAQNNISTERYGETRTPGFNILNFAVQKHILLKKDLGLHIDFGIENILDTPYYEHLDVMKIERQGLNFIFRVTFMF